MRLARAALRDLRQGGPRLVARNTLGMLRREAHRARYRFSPRYLVRRADSVRIDRPIFIVGVQGGGATVVARCLHRHPKTVYVAGNSDYWAAHDEIHNSSHIHDLPEILTHRSLHFGNADTGLAAHPRFGLQRAWLYATDELLPLYRRGAEDVDAPTRTAFRRVLSKIILAYAHDPDDCRLVDKSQLYTIQIPYVARMLDDARPRFVLLARDPYAACARAAAKEYGPARGAFLSSPEERLACAVEHWSNSYRLALEAGRTVPLLVVRYEDFLADPAGEVRRICEFAELEFSPELVPAAGQTPPLGSVEPDKWYPLKRSENTHYTRDADPRLIRALAVRAADVIEALGYKQL
jgi:hypothetical protein